MSSDFGGTRGTPDELKRMVMDSVLKRLGELEKRLTLEALEADGVNHTHNGTHIDDLEARIEGLERYTHAPQPILSDDGICRVVDRHFSDRRKAQLKTFVFGIGVATLGLLMFGASYGFFALLVRLGS